MIVEIIRVVLEIFVVGTIWYLKNKLNVGKEELSLLTEDYINSIEQNKKLVIENHQLETTWKRELDASQITIDNLRMQLTPVETFASEDVPVVKSKRKRNTKK